MARSDQLVRMAPVECGECGAPGAVDKERKRSRFKIGMEKQRCKSRRSGSKMAQWLRRRSHPRDVWATK